MRPCVSRNTPARRRLDLFPMAAPSGVESSCNKSHSEPLSSSGFENIADYTFRRVKRYCALQILGTCTQAYSFLFTAGSFELSLTLELHLSSPMFIVSRKYTAASTTTFSPRSERNVLFHARKPQLEAPSHHDCND